MVNASSHEAGRSPRFARGESAPAISLAAYNGFYSATPQAFALKAGHLPRTSRTAVIIVDVLRATTTWTAIAAAGTRALRIAVKDYAKGSAPPPEGWLQAGEKDGKPMPGGVIGNSPTEVTEEVFRSASVVFFSTNGARAVEAAAGFSDDIYLTCLPNIDATCQAIAESGIQNVIFIAGGFYGAATLEDTVCVGRGLRCLVELGVLSATLLDDEACMAIAAADAFTDDKQLIRALKGAQVGRLLAGIGRETDVEAVVNGRGIASAIWQAMQSMVLAYRPEEGVFTSRCAHPAGFLAMQPMTEGRSVTNAPV